MKYDASMTQFHGDIVAAIKSMLYGDSDKAKGLAADSSPTPLREYLKKEHGTKLHGGNRFDCSSSCFLAIFDRRINELGETRLQMSWSQVAKFIRDNPSEIFGEEDKSENAENSPSIEILDLDVRTFNAMKRAGINTLADVERLADYSLNHPDGLTLSDAHRKTIEAFKAYRDSQAQQETDFPCEDCGYDEKGCCNYPETPDDYCVCGDKQIPKNEEKPSFSIDEEISAPVQTETAVVFDYSELDTDTAAKLETVTAEIFNVRKEYIFTMAKKVAYAHDLLANHYGGKFGAWCESIGISRDTGNNMVRVAELFGNSTEIERQNLEKLTDGNVKLLYEAARPSAPSELVEAVKNGDITTHKEYIALKKQLEEAESRAEVAERNVDKLRENNQKMRTENIAALVRADKAEKQLEQSESRNRQFDESFKNIEAASKANYEKYLEELHKNQDLQVQIRKLEERPVEVAVEQDTAAIAERDERIAELEEQLRSRDSELDFGNNNASADKMSEFYEMLHGKALNALKDCMAFIRSDDLPQIVKNRAVGRFGTLKDLIEMYIDELEE